MKPRTEVRAGDGEGTAHGPGFMPGRRSARSGPWPSAGWFLILVAVAASVAAGVTAVVQQRELIPGLSNQGPFTEFALPLVSAGVDLFAALTIGWLLAAAWLVPCTGDRFLTVAGYRAVRAASLSAMVWALTSAASVPLIVSDTLGRSMDQVLSAELLMRGIGQLDDAQAAVVSTVLAGFVATCARVVLRPGGAGLLLVLALIGVLPQAATGHAAQAGDHDVAVDSMIYHLVGITLWMGGLAAVVTLARRRAAQLHTILARYSTVAGVAFVVVAASGMVNASVRVGSLEALWLSEYGRLVLLKALALLVLGGIGWFHRRHTLRVMRESNSLRPLIRLAAAELLIMAGTIGVAVALSGTAPPPAPTPTSELESELGFDLAGPPTLVRLVTEWRFDWILGTAATIAALLYLAGVHRLRRRGDRWPVGRTVAWLAGCTLVLVATSSGLGRYAETQFSVHMSAHMLLAMIAPAVLVMGGPVTLALRALPAAGAEGIPGAREALLAGVHSRPARILTHPLVVAALFIGSFAAVYFTGLFQVLVSTHLGHLVMNIHFLLTGYLYYWVVIGIDPGPRGRRLSPPARLGILMAPVPFHAFFGITMMNTRQPLAQTYYQRLNLPWVSDLVADQRLGGGIAWAATEAPLAVVIIALITQWARSDAREAERSDRAGGRAVDDELDGYNRMLTVLAERERRSTPHPPALDPESPVP